MSGRRRRAAPLWALRSADSSSWTDCAPAAAAEINQASALARGSTIRDTGSSSNGIFSYGADGASATVTTRNLVLQRIWNNQYFRNGRSLGTSSCDGASC